MDASTNDAEVIQKRFEKCRVGVISKWVVDVYKMGCAFRIEAHEVQMGIVMHSIIKYLFNRGEKEDLLTKCTLLAAIAGIQNRRRVP